MKLRRIIQSTAITLGLSMSLLGTAGASVASTATTVVPSGIAVSSVTSDTFAKKVFDLVNVERAKAGVQQLVWNQQISNGSQTWAKYLEVETKNPKFDFNKIHRPDAGRSILPSGFTWYSEIIGFNFTPESIVQWWIDSPSHKAAMLSPKATDIGFGVVKPTSGPYAGWNLVVSNLASYPGNVKPVSPPPATIVTDKRLNVVDPAGNLWGYDVPGSPTLISRNQIGQGWGAVNQLITADWNNDGLLDLVAKWGSGQITMYQGTGNGKYKSPVVIGTGWQNLDITVTKLRKSDTHPGIIARGIVDGKLYYYPNNKGSMNAGKIVIGNGGWQAMNELNALDWDKDGNMDIIARNGVGELKLYRGNGANGFIDEIRKTVGVGWNGMKSITAEPNIFGPGTVGLVAKSSNGVLSYYPVVKNGFQAKIVIGLSGWADYTISEGSPN